MTHVVAVLALCLWAAEPPAGAPYFADDFEGRTVGTSPQESVHGYGWRKVIAFEPPSQLQIAARPDAGSNAQCGLLVSGGAKPPVVDALLRLPERAEVAAAFDVRFDKGQAAYLAVAFCEGNYARLARLIFDYPAGADAVAVRLEHGAKGEHDAQVAALEPDAWARVVWRNDARRNTVGLSIDGDAVFDARPAEPTARFRRRAFSRLRFHGGKQGRVGIDRVVVTDAGQHAAQPKPRLDFAREPKEAVMCVDFFDLCFFASLRARRPYTPQDIEQLMRECKRAGIAHALWRVSACGSAVYRSEVEDRHFRQDTRPDAHAAEEFIERWDPLAEGCRMGHRAGIPVVVWMTVYDEGYEQYGHYSKLLREHPECQWVDRTGKHHFTGVPCYAFPAARRFRVQMIEEVCRWPVDGIMLSFRSHSVQTQAYRDAEEFGYEAPVVAEFKRRYGVDIRAQEFDRAAWHKLKGEYFTQLLREVRAAVGPWRSLSVLILDYVDGPSGKSQHALDVRTWLDERLIDALYVQGAWQSKPTDFASKYAYVREAGARLYCFRGIPDETATFENIPTLLGLVKGTPFNGLAMMEAYKFQMLRGQKR